jgi:hypothetical protein
MLNNNIDKNKYRAFQRFNICTLLNLRDIILTSGGFKSEMQQLLVN